MKNTTTIEQLQPSRWKEYKVLRLASMQKDPQAFGDKYDEWLHYSDEQWQERPNNPHSIILMAEENSKYIGMIGIYLKAHEDTQQIAHIWGMYIDDAYRGKGIGKLLMQEAITKLQTLPHVKKIQLMVNGNQKAAVGVYKSAGFEETGTQEWILGDNQKYNLLVMEKTL